MKAAFLRIVTHRYFPVAMTLILLGISIASTQIPNAYAPGMTGKPCGGFSRR